MRTSLSSALRGIALALGLLGAAALVAGTVAAPTALARKKKKKKKPVSRRSAGGEASTSASAGSSILSRKSAVKEKKVRVGPAKFKSKLTAAERDAKADEKRTEEIEELKKIIP